MDYTTFLSKAEFNIICLLCEYTDVDYLPWAVFDIITLNAGRKSAKFNESIEILALIWLYLFEQNMLRVKPKLIIKCYSFMVTNICITREYRTTTHSTLISTPKLI